MPKNPRTPSYRLHKPSGRAVVTLDGKDFYLGVHGTQTSRDEYDRLIAAWLANGRRLPDRRSEPLTVNEVFVQYYEPFGGPGVVSAPRLCRTPFVEKLDKGLDDPHRPLMTVAEGFSSARSGKYGHIFPEILATLAVEPIGHSFRLRREFSEA